MAGLTPTTTIAAGTAAVPVLTIAGMSLGLRGDVLLAGFAGALAGVAMLNTVPATGDTAIEMMRTALRRMGVIVTSALTAGYVTPLALIFAALPEAALLALAFVIGAGAQRVLGSIVRRVEARVGGGS